MDHVLRELQRRVACGDADALPAYAASLLRAGQPVAAFLAISAEVRRNEWARQLAAGAAPGAVYCTLCGDSLPLHPTGYPATPTGRPSRRRHHCVHCMDQIGRYIARGFPAPSDRYCRRCRAVRDSPPPYPLPTFTRGVGQAVDDWDVEAAPNPHPEPVFDHVDGCLGNVNEILPVTDTQEAQ